MGSSHLQNNSFYFVDWWLLQSQIPLHPSQQRKGGRNIVQEEKNPKELRSTFLSFPSFSPSSPQIIAGYREETEAEFLQILVYSTPCMNETESILGKFKLHFKNSSNLLEKI